MMALAHSLAVICLAITVIDQQRAVRRLRCDLRALRRDHVTSVVWFGVMTAGRPSGAAAAHDAGARQARIS